jgi:hypothetical protein
MIVLSAELEVRTHLPPTNSLRVLVSHAYLDTHSSEAWRTKTHKRHRQLLCHVGDAPVKQPN